MNQPPTIYPMSLGERMSVFRALVFAVWSDQRLVATEVSVCRAVAEELDLFPLHDVGSLLREGPPTLAELGLTKLGPWARRVAYATASWGCLADFEPDPAERRALNLLRRQLRLSREVAELLDVGAALVQAHRRTAMPRVQYRALLAAVADVGSFGPDQEADAA
ncbi:MAG: hypothetical protein ACFCGT_11425 [Sandaracinaceae bacterium]